MPLPFPRPSTVSRLTRSAVDHAVGSAAAVAALPSRALDSAATVAGLPARAFDILDSVESLVTRIAGVVDRAEAALERVDRVAGEAEIAVRRASAVIDATTGPVEQATRVAGAAAIVVADAEVVAAKAAATMRRAESTLGTASELLTVYEPALRRAAPMTRRFVEQLTPDEVDAAIRLVDELPTLTEHLLTQILPILATLDRVGPDIHDLLNVTRDLNLAVAGIPGLKMLRRRGEGRLAGEDPRHRPAATPAAPADDSP